MPIVCTGGGAHAPRILSHAFESTNGGVAYTAPFQTVRQTRALEAIGVPGRSRESINLACPEPDCRARPLISRKRWGMTLEDAQRDGQTWLDVAALG